jgi:hypothetical protein
MTDIRLLTGIPGAGKTYLICNELTRNPNRTILATTRIELIRERVLDLMAAAARNGTQPVIEEVHSATPTAPGQIRLPVASEIRSMIAKHSDTQHVVILTTHEGMMSANFDNAHGFDLVIDEAPAAVNSSRFDVPAAAGLMGQAYDLKPVDDEWSKIIVRPQAPTLGSFMRDEIVPGLAAFHKRAMSRQGVFVKCRRWDDLVNSESPLEYFSAWTPTELDAFNNITIAAAGYEASIGWKATKAMFGDQVNLIPEIVEGPARARPTVEIGYFTRGHKGSTTYWQKAGNEGLMKVAKYLATIDDMGYWATNNEFAPMFAAAGIKGKQQAPKTEGTNSLKAETVLAFIYSAKKLPGDYAVGNRFGISSQEFERARQSEDCVQFVFRSALRDPKFAGKVRVYLYDLDTAEMLASYIRERDLADVVLVPIDEPGIMDIARPKPGPEPEDPAIVAERRRKEDRDRKQRLRDRMADMRAAAGLPPKKRGRPRRVA